MVDFQQPKLKVIKRYHVYLLRTYQAQKKAYSIADNRMALDAGWDEELLAVELEGYLI